MSHVQVRPLLDTFCGKILHAGPDPRQASVLKVTSNFFSLSCAPCPHACMPTQPGLSMHVAGCCECSLESAPAEFSMA